MKEVIAHALTANIEPNATLGLVIGFISYVSLYMGKGVQKLAIEGIKVQTLRSKHTGIWVFGTVLTALPVFIQWAALAFAPVNLIAPLEGFGLLSLLIFSILVLKESITRKRIIGSANIIIGTILVAMFARPPELAQHNTISLSMLFIIAVPLLCLEIVALLISRKHTYRFAGPLIGFTAGTCMALQTLFKRISVIPELRVFAAVFVFIFTPLTLIVTQFGFVKAKAGEVVPLFTSGSILIATVFGVVILDEALHILQGVGIVLIITGIFFLTTSVHHDEV